MKTRSTPVAMAFEILAILTAQAMLLGAHATAVTLLSRRLVASVLLLEA